MVKISLEIQNLQVKEKEEKSNSPWLKLGPTCVRAKLLQRKTPGSLDSSLRGASFGLLTVQEASQTRKQNQNKIPSVSELIF